MQVKVDFKALKRLERKLRSQYPKVYEPAMSSALNKTLTTIRAEGARMIKSEMGAIRVSQIKRDMKKMNARRYRLRAILEARGSPLYLKEFSPSLRKKGISHRAWNKRRLIKGAFKATGDHVYIRQTKKRLPIKKLWGPGIARTMGSDEVSGKMLDVGREPLPINLIREINWRARKAGI